MDTLELTGPDPRRWDDAQLLAALRAHTPLALAEALHRTAIGVHSAACRLCGDAEAVEALLRATYRRLWLEPPSQPPLQPAVRRLAFDAALAARGVEPGSTPSWSWWSCLGDGTPTARALAALDDDTRLAVLLAHDAGRCAAQQGADAQRALVRGLATLGGAPDGVCGTCAEVPGLGDWALELLPTDAAGQVSAQLRDRPECRDCAAALRRGRRLLEGLPPPTDLLERVLVTAVTTAEAADSTPSLPLSEPENVTTAAPDLAAADSERIVREQEAQAAATASSATRARGLVRSVAVLVAGVLLGLAAVRLIL